MTIPARGVDHIVVAGPDLHAASRRVAEALDRELIAGGRHPGWGTRNMLLDLSAGSYLEVIGPDPGQPLPTEPRPFDVDRLTSPALVAWAVRTPDIMAAVAGLEREGIEFGPVTKMSREVPGRGVLIWRLTQPRLGPLPFLIDWGNSPHPTTTLPPGLQLEDLRIETHDEPQLTRMCRLLEVDVTVVASDRTRLVAEIRTESGTIELT